MPLALVMFGQYAGEKVPAGSLANIAFHRKPACRQAGNAKGAQRRKEIRNFTQPKTSPGESFGQTRNIKHSSCP